MYTDLIYTNLPTTCNNSLTNCLFKILQHWPMLHCTCVNESKTWIWLQLLLTVGGVTGVHTARALKLVVPESRPGTASVPTRHQVQMAPRVPALPHKARLVTQNLVRVVERHVRVKSRHLMCFNVWFTPYYTFLYLGTPTAKLFFPLRRCWKNFRACLAETFLRQVWKVFNYLKSSFYKGSVSIKH